MTGTQDNGTFGREDENSDAWPQLLSGDGGYLAYSTADPDVRYSTYVYLKTYRNDHGNITDVGTHAELMDRCTLYQRLQALQFKQSA